MKSRQTPRTRSGLPAEASPFAETLRRLSALDAGGLNLSAQLGAQSEPGWISAADLTGTNDEHLGELLRLVGRQYGTGDRAVAGTLFLRGYLWRILVPSVAALLAERLLPDLGPENVALSFDEGGAAAGLAFRDRFAVLEGDPGAASPGATVLEGEGEMLDWMGEELAGRHLPELFSAFRRCGVHRAERALWSVSSDILAEAFTWAGSALGREGEARGLAERALDGSPHFPGRTNFFVLEQDGVHKWTRTRNACCLYYRVSGEVCPTCPRISQRERLCRLAPGLRSGTQDAGGRNDT